MPSVVPALKTPSTTKRTHHRKSKKQRSEKDGLASTRGIPLPFLEWADSTEVWKNMILKEETSKHARNPRLFEKQACYLPRMRAILLDWLMEVCEVYKLRRVTYYLTVDYIDRYLTINPSIPKTQLQLVGVTCLFMAAKLEEIYPPKLSEFSYVCDGACTDGEITGFELMILNVSPCLISFFFCIVVYFICLLVSMSFFQHTILKCSSLEKVSFLLKHLKTACLLLFTALVKNQPSL